MNITIELNKIFNIISISAGGQFKIALFKRVLEKKHTKPYHFLGNIHSINTSIIPKKPAGIQMNICQLSKHNNKYRPHTKHCKHQNQ